MIVKIFSFLRKNNFKIITIQIAYSLILFFKFLISNHIFVKEKFTQETYFIKEIKNKKKSWWRKKNSISYTWSINFFFFFSFSFTSALAIIHQPILLKKLKENQIM